MKKQKLIKELSNIETIISDYFTKSGTKYLTILDGDSRQYLKDYTGYEIEGYKGVTVEYIRLYLFNKKYSKSMISYVLLKLLSEGNIKTLHCHNIMDVVFEPIRSTHYSNYFKTNHYNDGDNIEHEITYIKLIKSHKAIASYLK